jgi:arginase family enzyme
MRKSFFFNIKETLHFTQNNNKLIKGNIEKIYTNLVSKYNPKPYKTDKLYYFGEKNYNTIPSIAHSIRRVNDPTLLKLIWINTSSNLKKMENNEYSLRNALQFEKKSNNLFNEYIRIMPKNILYLGLNERNMNKYEKDLIKQNNIETISIQEISEHYKQTTDRISNFIDSTPVHISVNFNILETISTNSLVNIFNCYELHENKIGMDIIGKETYSQDKNLMNKII